MNKTISLLLLLSAMQIIHSSDKHSPGKWDAQGYAENASPQFINALKNLSQADFREDEEIVDFGAGPAKLAAYLVEKHIPKGHVHCIDASPEQIAWAKNTYKDNKRLSFEHAQIETYKTTKKYDKGLSFWTLHWLKADKDYCQAMSNVAQALKPGGQAFISHLIDEGVVYRQVFIETLQEAPWNSYSKGFVFPVRKVTLAAITQAIKGANLRIEDLHITTNEGHFKNQGECIKLL